MRPGRDVKTLGDFTGVMAQRQGHGDASAPVRQIAEPLGKVDAEACGLGHGRRAGVLDDRLLPTAFVIVVVIQTLDAETAFGAGRTAKARR